MYKASCDGVMSEREREKSRMKEGDINIHQLPVRKNCHNMLIVCKI